MTKQEEYSKFIEWKHKINYRDFPKAYASYDFGNVKLKIEEELFKIYKEHLSSLSSKEINNK